MNQVKFKKIKHVFDRDGVLNKDTGYLYKKEDFQWIEGVLDAISLLKDKGFKIIVVSKSVGNR